jgi:SAM-dependent methyltransferase
MAKDEGPPRAKGSDYYNNTYYTDKSETRPGISLVNLDIKYYARIEFLRGQLTPAERARPLLVWDLGAGSATVARTINAINEDPSQRINMRVISSDFSAEGIRHIPRAQRPPFVQANIYRLPIATGSVDGVTAYDVFEHLDNPDGAISEINRIIRPGGFIHFVNPNPQHKHPTYNYQLDESHIWPAKIGVDYFREALHEDFDLEIYTRGFTNSEQYSANHGGEDLIKPAIENSDGTHIIVFGRKKYK